AYFLTAISAKPTVSPFAASATRLMASRSSSSSSIILACSGALSSGHSATRMSAHFARSGTPICRMVKTVSSIGPFVVIFASRRPLLPSRQPPPDPFDRGARVVARARVTEADELVPVDRIEIDARRRRHVRLAQHALRKIVAVVGEARDVGVEIERAVDGKER